MKRIIYRIVYCSAEENQNGTFHYSPNFLNKKDAKAFGVKREDDWVVLEKCWQVYDRWEWRPDWDRGETSEILEYFI